ncbi:MAG: glycosyltransferase family 39 protein [Flexilinea sp.]|nr:glycosyltransferase family 39 protein [Flexilinea sp.]
MRKRRFRFAEWLFTGFALICLLLALCPFDAYKAFGDHFASDGNLERITPELVRIIHLIFALLFVFSLGMVLWGWFRRDSRDHFFRSLVSLPGRCVHDVKPFFCDLFAAFHMKPAAALGLLLIIAAGTVLRAIQLGVPLRYDEAYTIVAWGRSDLLWAISDYHLPNNHVFHTILLNLIFHHLGKSVPLLRLPVFISGCLLIGAVWLLGRTLYDDFIALFSAGFTAFAPYLIYYSVNARGYELQVLFTVITVGLVVYCRRKNNIFAWFLLIFFSGLNFYTLPTSLYPFGGICVWLFLNVIFFQTDNRVWRGRMQLFKYLIFMGLSVSAFTFVLYLPIIRRSGLNSLFGNGFVQPRDASFFWRTAHSYFSDSITAFSGTLPPFVLWCIVLGIVLSIFLFKINSRERISYGLAVALWMGPLILIQRPEMLPRLFLFLHPFLLLYAASGLSGMRLVPYLGKVSGWISASLVLAMAISQFYVGQNSIGVVGTNERAIQVIREREGTNVGNILFVTAPAADAPNWAYAEIYNLPEKIFDKRSAFNTVYVYVNPSDISDYGREPKTLDDMLAKYGPGGNFIIPESAEILMDEPDCVLYRFDGREGSIRKAYGEYPPVRK